MHEGERHVRMITAYTEAGGEFFMRGIIIAAICYACKHRNKKHSLKRFAPSWYGLDGAVLEGAASKPGAAFWTHLGGTMMVAQIKSPNRALFKPRVSSVKQPRR